MGKKFFAALVVLFVASSIGLGVIGYKAVSSESVKLEAMKQYDWVMELTSEYSLIEKTGMDGNYFFAMVNEDKAFLIDETGKKIEQVDYGWIEGTGNAYIFTEDKKMGYKNLDGEVLIPARYDYIGQFDGGYAESSIGDRHFVINEKGREIYRTDNKDDITFHHISGKYFGEEYEGKYKVIDAETGKTMKEWNSAYCQDIRYEMPGLYQASGINGYYFLDENFEPTFDGGVYDFGAAMDFSEGLCYVEKITNGTYNEDLNSVSKERGYINSGGEAVIETKGSMYGGDFSEGKALVYGAKKAWAIDKKGKTLFTIKMKKNLAVSGPDASESFKLYAYILNGSIFQHGMIPVYDGTKMGLADEKGHWILEPVFDDMDFVGDHLVAVEYSGRWGIIRV